MLKNVPILSGPVMNIKISLDDILSNNGWLQQLNQRHGPAMF